MTRLTRMTRPTSTKHTPSRASRAIAPAAAAAAVFLIAGCGGAAKSATPDAGKAPAPKAAAGPVLEVTGAEFSFAPVALKASAGKTTIRLVNKGVVEHDFTIDALKVKVHAAPGKTTEATVTLKPGSYKSYCSVAGHLQSGMAGTLTVS